MGSGEVLGETWRREWKHKLPSVRIKSLMRGRDEVEKQSLV